MYYSCSTTVLELCTLHNYVSLLPYCHAATVYSGIIHLTTLMHILSVPYTCHVSKDRLPYIVLLSKKRVML